MLLVLLDGPIEVEVCPPSEDGSCELLANIARWAGSLLSIFWRGLVAWPKPVVGPMYRRYPL